MVWFKVDDTLAFHEKVLAAGNAAMGLWVRAGSWSSQQLTEGFVREDMARTLGRAVEIKRLVESGLWAKVAGGYQFHQWSEDGRQPTRAQVEADRQATRDRQRRARERAKEARESLVSNDVRNGVTNADVTPVVTVPPTRPDPTRVYGLSLVDNPLLGDARETSGVESQNFDDPPCESLCGHCVAGFTEDLRRCHECLAIARRPA